MSMQVPTNFRTPCPNRIYEDTGVAFTIGAIGGVVFQLGQAIFTKYRSRTILKIGSKFRYRVPTTSGSFALWGLSFSSCECSLQKFGIKNQAASAIISGGLTGAILAAQRSRKSIFLGAFFGFLILSMIEMAIVFAEKTLSNDPSNNSISEQN
uniref:Putative mitochondrial import inner membrane translocase subunit Tim17 4 (Trinotate prediction) n=1 Tax=Myxobolus squamalis TaxID=59785 RepID=A0A6B2G8X8_MYXSQ